MKILLVNCVYNLGSTGKITRNLATDYSQSGNDVLVVCDEKKQDRDDNNTVFTISDCITRFLTKVLERVTGLTGCFSFFATNRAIRRIRSFNPEVAVLGNLHGCYINIYRLYKELKKLNIPIIQIMWDEYSMTGSCAFAYDCMKYEKKCCNCSIIHSEYPKSWFFDTSSILQKMKKNAYCYDKLAFVAVPYTATRAKRSSLLEGKTIISLDEAINQEEIFYPRDTSRLRKELGIPKEKKVIIDVCVYPSIRKGGKFFLQLAKECLDLKDVVFVHVGFGGDLSECPENYFAIRHVKDQNLLAEYYSLGDLFVCTSLAETQPSACLEALSCGTPLCGFNVSGIPTCADYPFGQYVQLGDIKAMKQIVKTTAKKTYSIVNAVRNYARGRFSSHDYSRKIFEIGKHMVNGEEFFSPM